MESVRKRVPSEVLKRGYSDEEVRHIYELGRLFLENGDTRRAEAIMNGLAEVAPDFAPVHLALSYVHFQSKNVEAAAAAARHALKIDPNFTEAMLAEVSALMSLGDYNSAGTLLGEIGEKIDSGLADDPRVMRFYQAQLARFQSR